MRSRSLLTVVAASLTLVACGKPGGGAGGSGNGGGAGGGGGRGGGGSGGGGSGGGGSGSCVPTPCDLSGNWTVTVAVDAGGVSTCLPRTTWQLTLGPTDGGVPASLDPSRFCNKTAADTLDASVSDAGSCELTLRRGSTCIFSGEYQCEDLALTLVTCAGGKAQGAFSYRRCWCPTNGPSPWETYPATAQRN